MSGQVWPVVGVNMSRDECPPETEKNHVNELRNTLIEIWTVKIHVSQVDRHVDPLNRSEALVDGSLMLQVSNKVDSSAFGGYGVSV